MVQGQQDFVAEFDSFPFISKYYFGILSFNVKYYCLLALTPPPPLLNCDLLPGWLCSSSFSQNWTMPSIILGSLKEGTSLHGNVEQLLGSDSCSLIWKACIYALWCELWPIHAGEKLEYHHRPCSTHWVSGDRHICKIHNVVLSGTLPLTVTQIFYRLKLPSFACSTFSILTSGVIFYLLRMMSNKFLNYLLGTGKSLMLELKCSWKYAVNFAVGKLLYMEIYNHLLVLRNIIILFVFMI